MKAVLMFAFMLMYIGLCGYAIFEGLAALFFTTMFSFIMLGMSVCFDSPSPAGKPAAAMMALITLVLATALFGFHWFR